VPIGFGAQTVGPFQREAERSILANVYGAAVVIVLRESDSIRNVLELGARAEQLLVTADESFGLFGAAPATQRRGIACVVSRDPQLRADGTLADRDTSVGTLARLVAELVRLSDGEGVTMLSTFQGLGGLERGFEDDGDVAAEVVAALPPAVAADVRTTAGYLPPQRCAHLIAAHRALVTTRMHPAIFGVSLGVPTVLLSEAYKATSMFATLGLEHAVVDRPDPASVAARLSPSAGRAVPADAAVARERCGWNDAVVQRLLAAVP
jgi:colanic acid/amylovoran biosynthesis protein